jgi:hypothetical protein
MSVVQCRIEVDSIVADDTQIGIASVLGYDYRRQTVEAAPFDRQASLAFQIQLGAQCIGRVVDCRCGAAIHCVEFSYGRETKLCYAAPFELHRVRTKGHVGREAQTNARARSLVNDRTKGASMPESPCSG